MLGGMNGQDASHLRVRYPASHNGMCAFHHVPNTWRCAHHTQLRHGLDAHRQNMFFSHVPAKRTLAKSGLGLPKRETGQHFMGLGKAPPPIRTLSDMTKTFTYTEIEHVGQGRLALRCRRCGLIDDGSDREFLKHMAEQHDKICPALKGR